MPLVPERCCGAGGLNAYMAPFTDRAVTGGPPDPTAVFTRRPPSAPGAVMLPLDVSRSSAAPAPAARRMLQAPFTISSVERLATFQ